MRPAVAADILQPVPIQVPGQGFVRYRADGLEALMSRNSGSLTITQEMAGQAVDIWRRLDSVARPKLAGLINHELTRHNNLQDFVGGSFKDWFFEISADPPRPWAHLPGASKSEGS